MNDATFYQRIDLLDDDALEEMPAPPPRALRVRPRLGKPRRIMASVLLHMLAMTMILVGFDLALDDALASDPPLNLPLLHGILLMVLGCALVTVLMFGLAALKDG